MPHGGEVLDRAKTAWAARYALRAASYPGARVDIGRSVAGYLAPNVRADWLDRFFREGGRVTLAPVSAPLVRTTGGYVPPAGQTLGPLGSGFAGVARAPGFANTPVVMQPQAGTGAGALGGILQHELAHVYQRSNPALRLSAALGILGRRVAGVPQDVAVARSLEPYAYRVAGGSVANTRLGDIPAHLRPLYSGLLASGRRGGR